MSRRFERGALRARLQYLGDVAFDRLLGVQTTGIVSQEELGFERHEGVHYQGSNWLNLIGIWRYLRELGVSPDDGLLEIGCGKGQVLIVASRFPFGRIVGIDRSGRMVTAARRNLESSRLPSACPRVDVLVADAAAYAVPTDITVCYLYNPFPAKTLGRVLQNVDASLRARPRTMHVIYLNPPDMDMLSQHGYEVKRRARSLYLLTKADPGSQHVGDRP